MHEKSFLPSIVGCPAIVRAASFLGLLLLWLPSERSRMPMAISAFLLLLFLTQRYKVESGKSTGYLPVAVAANSLLVFRFCGGWISSQKVLRLAGMVYLSPKALVGCTGGVLFLVALPAAAEMLHRVIVFLFDKNAPECIGASHYDNLDALKALLAVLIFFHHYQQVFGLRFAYINFYHGKLEFAWIVELFFMISGFLTAITHRDGQKRILAFCKKCLRFYPSAWLSMCFVLVALVFWDKAAFARMTAGDVLGNFLLIFSGYGITLGYTLNNPAWYLCVLSLCYGLYYIADYLSSKAGINRLAVFASLAFLSIYLLWFDDYPFFNYSARRGYGPFFLGAALALPLCTCSNRTAGIFALAMGALSVPTLIFQPADWETIVMALFPALLTTVLRLPQFKWKALSILGKCSFQLYLWHAPLFRLTRLFLPEGFHHSFVTMAAALVIAELFAFLFYYAFEKPTAKAIKRVLS